jgi:cobalt/nickel transport protein
MNVQSTEPWIKAALLGIVVLVVLTPLFGWASGVVGYAEPLENAAEATGGAAAATTTLPGLLPDYSVPGLSSPVGTLVSAVVGTGLTLLIALGTGRLLES